MSEFQEAYRLSMDEILTILYLGGKETLFGFRPENMEPLTQQRMWMACCRLLEDGAMTQEDGDYWLDPDVLEIMLPLRDAKNVLILTPANDGCSQVAYYIADRITAMEPVIFGGYSLRTLAYEHLNGSILSHLGLKFQTPELPEPEIVPQTGMHKLTQLDKLLGNAEFVLECMDAQKNFRKGWLRGFQQGLELWLEWTKGAAMRLMPLTPEGLGKALEELIRGET